MSNIARRLRSGNESAFLFVKMSCGCIVALKKGSTTSITCPQHDPEGWLYGLPGEKSARTG